MKKIPEDIRKDIPLTKKIIYFDNAATCLTPLPVIEKIKEYYLEYRANIHRGLHKLSIKASEEYELTRKKVAKFINAKHNEIVFTKNSTEGINIVAHSLQIKKGDKIVTTKFEHHSNLLPWIILSKNKGIKVEFVEVNKEGLINLEDLENKCKNAKLVAIHHVSNVTGAIQDVKEIGKIAKENECLYLIDAAQSIGHMCVDVKKLNCDFSCILWT